MASAEKITEKNATAADYEQAANRHTRATWYWLAFTLVIYYLWDWWAVIPILCSLLSVANVVYARKKATEKLLEENTSEATDAAQVEKE